MMFKIGFQYALEKFAARIPYEDVADAYAAAQQGARAATGAAGGAAGGAAPSFGKRMREAYFNTSPTLRAGIGLGTGGAALGAGLGALEHSMTPDDEYTLKERMAGTAAAYGLLGAGMGAHGRHHAGKHMRSQRDAVHSVASRPRAADMDEALEALRTQMGKEVYAPSGKAVEHHVRQHGNMFDRSPGQQHFNAAVSRGMDAVPPPAATTTTSPSAALLEALRAKHPGASDRDLLRALHPDRLGHAPPEVSSLAEEAYKQVAGGGGGSSSTAAPRGDRMQQILGEHAKKRTERRDALLAEYEQLQRKAFPDFSGFVRRVNH